MKKLILAFSIVSLVVSCKSSLKGNGSIIEKEERLNEKVNELNLSGNYQAVLIQDEENKYVIEASDNLIPNLHIEFEEGVLQISEKETAETDDIYKIYVYSNQLNTLTLNDNVEFDVSGQIKSERLELDLRDHSKFLAQLSIDDFEINVEDNASLSVMGSTKNFEADFSDAAKMLSPDFIVGTADIELSDNAEVNIQIVSKLKGMSQDNSVLEYKGNPDKDFNSKDQSKIIKVEE